MSRSRLMFGFCSFRPSETVPGQAGRGRVHPVRANYERVDEGECSESSNGRFDLLSSRNLSEKLHRRALQYFRTGVALPQSSGHSI